MGRIRDFFSKGILAVKKQKYEKRPDQVSIRFEDVPEWLYKITIKNPEGLKEKIATHVTDIRAALKELGLVLDRINLRDVFTATTSKYKREATTANRNLYVKRLKEFIEQFSSISEQSAVGDLKVTVTTIKSSLPQLRDRLSRLEESLQDLYAPDIKSVHKAIDNISHSLNLTEEVFAAENYFKVNAIAELVGEIKGAIKNREKLYADIDLVDQKIKDVEAHVLKLRDSATHLKQSTRFQDVLGKDDGLRNLITQRNEKVHELHKHVDRIKPYFESYAARVKENVESFIAYPEYVLMNNGTIKKLIALFLDDLMVKQPPATLSETDAGKIRQSAQWLIENADLFKQTISDLDRRILVSRKYLKQYVVLNELEDIEARIDHYQQKLTEVENQKRDIKNKLVALRIPELQEKLRKDMLIVTGYDVSVLYDEFAH